MQQLDLFGAPGHTLRDVAYIATMPWHTVMRRPVSRLGEVTGPSAVAVVGDMPSLDEEEQRVRDGRGEAYVRTVRAGIARRHPLRRLFTGAYAPLFNRPCSRWVPVVTACDRHGCVRGTVGAVLLHYDGLCCSSRWAYFGADNVDLDGGRENADHFNAWARECLNGFAESGRRYLVTAEVSGEDMHRDIFRALDFVSISCYHRYAENPVQVRLREMRAIGKSFTNAEFGRQASSSTPADHHSPAGRQAVACRDIGRVPCRTTSTGASCRRRSRCRS